jgi:hypothetical protein
MFLMLGLIIAGCATGPSGRPARDETAQGREQLVRAFDAAWIRVLASGKDREILKTMPPQKPGLAASYMMRLVDCLPSPDLAPFPEKPVGLLKQVLDTGVIRMGVQSVPSTPGDTSNWFAPISDAYFAAVIDEIEKHYAVQLKVEEAALPPGPAPTTSLLLDGKADFIGQLNATGGETQGLRRRISRRFTCTMSASSQYIHIPAQSALAKAINSMDDLAARPDVRICAGPLTTQTARAFLPQHKVSTKYVNDLTDCVKDVQEGRADVVLNPLPDLAIADVNGFRAVPTLLVAGTPLWVALEGIECPSDGNPRTEDQCVELSPP